MAKTTNNTKNTNAEIVTTNEDNHAIGHVEPGLGISDEDAAELTRGGTTPYISIVAKNADCIVNQEPEGVEAGDLLLGKKEILPQGTRAAVLRMRPRAILFEDGEMALESFNPKSEDWAKIRAVKNGGKAGNEFLLWLFEKGTFATLAFMNTSAPNGATCIKANKVGNEVLLHSEFVQGKKHSWFNPIVKVGAPVNKAELPPQSLQESAILSFEQYKTIKSPATNPTSRPQ